MCNCPYGKCVHTGKAQQTERVPRKQFLEIRVVANGYVVGMPRGDREVPWANAETYAFESFNSLVAWMRENLERADINPERPQP